MKRSTFIFALLIFTSTIRAQNIVTVSQVPGEGNFSSLQNAINAATPGDIIMIYPGTYLNDVTLNKRLVLIGAGFEFSTNYPEIQTFVAPSYINGELTLTGAGASNSVIKGLDISTLNLFEVNNIIVENTRIRKGTIRNGSNVLVRKCYVGGAHYTGISSSNANIRIEGINFISFKTTLFDDPFYYASNWLGREYCINGKDGNSGQLELDNCIFRNQIRLAGYGPTSNNYSNTTLILKNSIEINSGIPNVILTNNASPAFINNNFFEYSAIIPNNVSGINPAEFFVGYPVQGPYSFDKRYQLKPLAPAKNVATHGGDCGIYGSDEPYKPGGLPDIPLIYELTVPQNAGSNINVNIKVRSEN